MFRYLCVFVGLLNSHWVRGEVEKDSMSTFYEMVSSLSGDQPPVVMVGFYELVITFIFVMIECCRNWLFCVSVLSRVAKVSTLFTSGTLDFTGSYLRRRIHLRSLLLSFWTGKLKKRFRIHPHPQRCMDSCDVAVEFLLLYDVCGCSNCCRDVCIMQACRSD